MEFVVKMDVLEDQMYKKGSSFLEHEVCFMARFESDIWPFVENSKYEAVNCLHQYDRFGAINQRVGTRGDTIKYICEPSYKPWDHYRL